MVTAACLWILGIASAASSWAGHPIVDPLDGLPLKWSLGSHDSRARVSAHWLDATGGEGARPCEAVTLVASLGTRADLVYRIEPAAVIDDVEAQLSVWSLNAGVQLGLRVCYPRVLDPVTREPVKVVLWSDSHAGRGVWQRLTARPGRKTRNIQRAALRKQFGQAANLNDAFIDAVVVNAYTGAGHSTIKLDNLEVRGLVSLRELTGANSNARQADTSAASRMTNADAHAVDATDGPFRAASNAPVVRDPQQLSMLNSAFPTGRIHRVIEYRGEPIASLKLMGFDGIVTNEPLSADLLNAASQADMDVYAAPPQAVHPELEPWLSSVKGWYLGTSVDDRQLEYSAQLRAQIAQLPALWQRPLMVAPAESWDRYAGIATTMIYDLPLSLRGLSAAEEIDLLNDQMQRTGRPVVGAVGVATSPPLRLRRELDGIAKSLGATAIGDYGWRHIVLQGFRGLTVRPSAVIYRSSDNLTSGDQLSSVRTSAIGLLNAWIDMLQPWILQSIDQESILSEQRRYVLSRIGGPRSDLWIANRNQSAAAHESRPNDGQTLRIPIRKPGTFYAWRITDTAAEQLAIREEPGHRWVEIENPDYVELVVTTNEATMGAEIVRRFHGRSVAIVGQRWQLVRDSLSRCREDWRSAQGGGLVPGTAVPTQLLEQAARQLLSVPQQMQQREFAAAMRAVRAADDLCNRCEYFLAQRLSPFAGEIRATPTLQAPGAVMLHLAWLPGVEDGQWTGNLLMDPDLNDADRMLDAGWSYNTRLENLAETRVELRPHAGEQGDGALRVEVVGRGLNLLPGGFAGTVAHISSAPISVQPGNWVRVRTRVKTLGFGGPHQGLLIFDSDCGSELGQLVRNQSEWTTVEFYRFITQSDRLRIHFEAIGSGVASIDSLEVTSWRPAAPTMPLQPISPRTTRRQGDVAPIR